MGETRETKTVIDTYGAIWCTEKDGVYAPISLDSSYAPTFELIEALSTVGMRVTRCYSHARVTIQDEVPENQTPRPNEIKAKLGYVR